MRPQLACLALIIACATPAGAQSPAQGCAAGMARAATLIDRVAERDRAGPIADPARLCATLRLNRREMAEATGIMARCLTGHERAENVGQLQASIGDVDRVIARRCR